LVARTQYSKLNIKRTVYILKAFLNFKTVAYIAKQKTSLIVTVLLFVYFFDIYITVVFCCLPSIGIPI
jgi:hypothetical protein